MSKERLEPPERLSTERLVLRLPRPGDAEAIFRGYAQDPEVTRYLIWSPHSSLGETKAFLKQISAARAAGTEYTWAIVLERTGELVGMIALRLAPPRADFGYVIARARWNAGYATEAAGAVADWALEQPSIHRLWTVCDVDNTASVRVLEKLGMRREGVLRKWMIHSGSGEPRDCCCYARIKGERVP